MKLYNFFRSSAAFRVRIALNLKNIAYDEAFIHLSKDGGQNEKGGPFFRGDDPDQITAQLVGSRQMALDKIDSLMIPTVSSNH